MGLNILPKATPRPPIFYGWLIVTIAFVMAFVMAGSGSAFGVFVIPMSEEFAWNRSLISVAFLFATLVSGLSQPFLGHLCDRFGGRKVIVVSLMMMGVCTMILSLTFHILFLILLYGVVMSICRSGGSLGSTSWIIARWFRRKRATALALSMAGASLGAMVLVPLAAYLVDRTSWRFTWVALGAIVLILALPLAFFLRDDPTDVGLLPDGDAASAADSHTASLAQTVRGPLEAEHWSQSFRSLPIWQFSGAYWACGFITAMMMMHFIPYAEGKGFSRATAATAFGLMSGLNVVGLLATGLLSDKFGRKNVLASIYAIRVLAFGLLLVAPAALGLWGFAVILGLTWYSSAPLTTSLTADIYGLKTLGVLNGVTFLAHQVGGALSVLLAGIMYDLTGSYMMPFAMGGILMVWASVAAFSINEKKYSMKYQSLPASG